MGVSTNSWQAWGSPLFAFPPLPSSSVLDSSSLRSRAPKIQQRGLGERCKLPKRNRILVHFCRKKNLTSGGNNFDDFTENQVTEFHGEFSNFIHAEFGNVNVIDHFVVGVSSASGDMKQYAYRVQRLASGSMPGHSRGTGLYSRGTCPGWPPPWRRHCACTT